LTSTETMPNKDPGKRATSLVRELARPDSDVYELFAQLDALPKDTVLAALASTTGPSRPPEELDDDLRRVHGFPEPPLRLTCTRVVKATAEMRLGETTVEQIERACTTWDGLVLPFATRLAAGSEFAGKVEHHTFDDLEGMPQYDIVLLHGDSGAIFRAGETDVFGTIAYGKVEVLDRRERRGLQAALDGETAEVAPVAPPAPVEAAEEEAAAEDIAAEAPAPRTKAVTRKKVAAPKEKAVVAKTKAAPKKKAAAAPKKKAAAAPEKKAAAAPKKKAAAAPKKKTAAKKATKKKAAAAPKKKAATAPKKKAATAPKKKAAAAPKKKTAAKKATKKKA
jgi:hypothetical protein